VKVKFNFKKRIKRPEFIILLIIIIGGFSYIHYTWSNFKALRSTEAMQIARTAEASLPSYLISKLKAVPDDIDNPDYKIIKERLREVVKVNPRVSFAYFFAEKNGRLFFIVDSEPESSEDYSPPGQEYTEAQDEDIQPFLDGKEYITDPLEDRWGTWVTAYIPVIEKNTGKVVSVFGMDFDSTSWNKRLYLDVTRAVLFFLLVLLAWYFQYRIIIKNRSLKKMVEAAIKAEKDLQASEARMRSVTDSANDAILMIDHNGNIAYWNPAAERIFGYSLEEAMGQNLHKLIAHEKYHVAHKKAFSHFLKTGEGGAIGKTLDLEAIKKDGTIISVQLSLSAIQIEGNWNAIGILRDTTERKRIEEALVKAKQESEAANKAKSIFLSNMSHEIRTPLNAIIGFSQLINRDRRLSDQQREYNTSIIKASEHLLELINEILELSKIEAGRIVLNVSNIDLHVLCDDIHMLFKERALDKHLQLIFENAKDLPKYIMIDEGKLRQLFVNIIGNAIKFTEEGGVAIRTQVVKDDDETWFLVVEVEDSGPGISEEEMGKLFRHFEQTSTGVKKGTGTGLGLALSRELALLMGGDITVTSKLGEGSIFTFKVEIKEGNPDEIEKKDTKHVVSIENRERTYKILVVDDKKENLQVAVNLLNIVGFITIEAVDGKDAIEKFIESKPDLVLMDMRMPVMDGYESTRIIKSMEEGKDIPIVALTASTFEDERKRIKALNMQGYIRKPFREGDLFRTIGKLLHLKYIYEEDLNEIAEKIPVDNNKFEEDFVKLPELIVSEMLEAISVADLDKLTSIINGFETEYPCVAHKLMNLAKGYEYDNIEKLLKERRN